jgi:transcription initiation factor TFIID subunit 3
MREITSVMMTTGGFISPAREGKLPEARTPFWLGQGPFLEESSDDELPETEQEVPPPPPPTRPGPRGPPTRLAPMREQLIRTEVPVNPKFRPFEFGDADNVAPQVRPITPREQKVVPEKPNKVVQERPSKVAQEKKLVVVEAIAKQPIKKPKQAPPPPLIRKPIAPPPGALKRFEQSVFNKTKVLLRISDVNLCFFHCLSLYLSHITLRSSLGRI